MNWKLWLKGLGNAAINAGIGAVAPIVVTWAQTAATGKPDSISGSTVGYMALGSAILGAINYFMTSPRQSTPPLPVEPEKK